MLRMAAGGIKVGTARRDISFVERGLPEPYDWTPHEINVLRITADICNCAECRQSLREKELQLKQAGFTNPDNTVLLQ